MTSTEDTTVIAARDWSVTLPDRHRLDVHAELVHRAGNTAPYHAITGELLNLRKRGDNRIVAGGAIHDLIAEHVPATVPLILLHLSDDQGRPMHAAANAAYWAGMARWGDGAPMVPDHHATIAVEPDDTGTLWAPGQLAAHLRVAGPDARRMRADAIELAAAKGIPASLAWALAIDNHELPARWMLEASAGLALLRGEL